MLTKEIILNYLEAVTDPEIPVLTIQDMGIIRDIQILGEDAVEIFITPTYSGCPAMSAIATNIRLELISRGVSNVKISEQLSPAWTTDWMSEAGKSKLNAYGIAPPQYRTKQNPENEQDVVVPCPLCNSTNTTLLSQFGSTACKALYKCKDCLEPFDYFKCH